MSCKGDWRGRSEAKDVVRERAWAALEASGDARDDDGPRGRIPDFVGAEEAAAALAETPEWQQARVVKSNPDPPQAPLRRRALEEGKTVYVPVPQLTEDTPFLKLDPAALKAKGVAVADAATAAGAARHGEGVRFDQMEKFDIAIVGSVAVAREGARLGKGGGFADLEMGIFRHYGWVTPGETPIVTTVHPTQLVDGVLSAALDEWDVPLDLICCPGEVIRTQTALPQPTKTVSWSAVRPDQFRDIPFLTDLRREMDGLFAHDNS